MKITKTLLLKSISGKELNVEVSTTRDYDTKRTDIEMVCNGVTEKGNFSMTKYTQPKIKAQLLKISAVALFGKSFPITDENYKAVNKLIEECEKQASADLGYIKYSKELKENEKLQENYEESNKRTLGALNA